MRNITNTYDSKEWNFVRQSVLRECHHLCQECYRYGRVRQATCVHHIYPCETYPEYRLCKWNLVPLCMGCHNKMHIRGSHELTDDGKRWQRARLLDKQQYDEAWRF